MTFKALDLPPHIQEHLAAARHAEHDKRVVFANLSDADLATSAQFWMQHCEAPKRFERDAPVYDSTLWHIILPELIRRLGGTP